MLVNSLIASHSCISMCGRMFTLHVKIMSRLNNRTLQLSFLSRRCGVTFNTNPEMRNDKVPFKAEVYIISALLLRSSIKRTKITLGQSWHVKNPSGSLVHILHGDNHTVNNLQPFSFGEEKSSRSHPEE